MDSGTLILDGDVIDRFKKIIEGEYSSHHTSPIILECFVKQYRSINDSRGLSSEQMQSIATMQFIQASLLEYMMQFQLAVESQSKMNEIAYTVAITVITTALTLWIGGALGIGGGSLLGLIKEPLEEVFVDPIVEAIATKIVKDLGGDEYAQMIAATLAESGREGLSLRSARQQAQFNRDVKTRMDAKTISKAEAQRQIKAEIEANQQDSSTASKVAKTALMTLSIFGLVMGMGGLLGGTGGLGITALSIFFMSHGGGFIDFLEHLRQQEQLGIDQDPLQGASQVAVSGLPSIPSYNIKLSHISDYIKNMKGVFEVSDIQKQDSHKKLREALTEWNIKAGSSGVPSLLGSIGPKFYYDESNAPPSPERDTEKIDFNELKDLVHNILSAYELSMTFSGQNFLANNFYTFGQQSDPTSEQAAQIFKNFIDKFRQKIKPNHMNLVALAFSVYMSRISIKNTDLKTLAERVTKIREGPFDHKGVVYYMYMCICREIVNIYADPTKKTPEILSNNALDITDNEFPISLSKISSLLLMGNSYIELSINAEVRATKRKIIRFATLAEKWQNALGESLGEDFANTLVGHYLERQGERFVWSYKIYNIFYKYMKIAHTTGDLSKIIFPDLIGNKITNLHRIPIPQNNYFNELWTWEYYLSKVFQELEDLDVSGDIFFMIDYNSIRSESIEVIRSEASKQVNKRLTPVAFMMIWESLRAFALVKKEYYSISELSAAITPTKNTHLLLAVCSP